MRRRHIIASVLGFLAAGFAVALISAVHAGEKQASPDDLPLFPLKKGLTWEKTYVWPPVKSSKFGTREVKTIKGLKVVVADIVAKGNLTCYELAQLGGPADLYWTQRDYVAAKEDGWYLTEQNTGGEGGLTSTFQPPCCILKTYKSKDQTWQSTYTDVSKSNAANGAVVRFKRKKHFLQTTDTITHHGKRVKATAVTETRYDWDDKKSAWTGPWWRITTWYLPGKGEIKRLIHDPNPDGPGFLQYGCELITTAFSGDASVITIGDVVLNRDVVEKEASSEAVEAPPGVVSEFERSRTITREVSYSTKLGLGTEAEVRISGTLLAVRGELTTKVKGTIEKAMGEKFSDSETRKQTIRINGDKLPKAKISWIDIYRTGTVQVIQDGQTYSIPFQFPIGTRLVIRAVK